MAKAPEPIFPQRMRVVNMGLKLAIIKDGVAVVATSLGDLRLPLSWWRQHKNDPNFDLDVSAVRAVERHLGATHGEKEPQR